MTKFKDNTQVFKKKITLNLFFSLYGRPTHHTYTPSLFLLLTSLFAHTSSFTLSLVSHTRKSSQLSLKHPPFSLNNLQTSAPNHPSLKLLKTSLKVRICRMQIHTPTFVFTYAFSFLFFVLIIFFYSFLIKKRI